MPSAHDASDETVVHPADRVIAALARADSALRDGLGALRPFANDDDYPYKLADLVEDALRDVATARRKAHRVVRDHDRRAVAVLKRGET